MEETPENINLDFEITPLRGFAIEVQAIFEENISLGYSERVAATIAAHMLYDYVIDRDPHSEDDDPDDDEYGLEDPEPDDDEL
jgi:hypothetical protein